MTKGSQPWAHRFENVNGTNEQLSSTQKIDNHFFKIKQNRFTITRRPQAQKSQPIQFQSLDSSSFARNPFIEEALSFRKAIHYHSWLCWAIRRRRTPLSWTSHIDVEIYNEYKESKHFDILTQYKQVLQVFLCWCTGDFAGFIWQGWLQAQSIQVFDPRHSQQGRPHQHTHTESDTEWQWSVTYT